MRWPYVSREQFDAVKQLCEVRGELLEFYRKRIEALEAQVKTQQPVSAAPGERVNLRGTGRISWRARREAFVAESAKYKPDVVEQAVEALTVSANPAATVTMNIDSNDQKFIDSIRKKEASNVSA